MTTLYIAEHPSTMRRAIWCADCIRKYRWYKADVAPTDETECQCCGRVDPPECRQCMNPVTDPEQIESAERIAERVSVKYPGTTPVYFCNDWCAMERYL